MFTRVGRLLGSTGAKDLGLRKEAIVVARDDDRKLRDLGPPPSGRGLTG